MPKSVTCKEFSYIGKPIEQSGLLETWFKEIDVTVYDDLPSIETYIENKGLGIELSIDDEGLIQSIAMFRHTTLKPPVAGSFDLSRAELRKKLGTPAFSYEKDLTEPFDFLWKSNDKWLNADQSAYISFTYNEDDSHIFQIVIGNNEPFH